MKRNIWPLLFGLAFVLAGAGFLCSVLFDWDFSIFFDGWWTLFIIVPALVSIFANGPRTAPFIALAIGVILLLRAQDVLRGQDTWIAMVSSVIILVGIGLIVRFIRPNHNTVYYNSAGTSGPTPGYSAPPPSGNFNSDTSQQPTYNAVLSGSTVRNVSTDFRGAKVCAVLGGVDLDLRDAVVQQDCRVEVSAVLGGVEIWAPRNVRIALTKTDILGGTECKAPSLAPDSGAPLVTFDCTAALGGIDIK